MARHGDEFDVAVVGAGPAGATAARLLAEWGHTVALLTRPPERRSLAESLPPSTRKLLAHVGMLPRVESAGFLPATGNSAWWGGAPGRSEEFADEAGFQVLRADFDRLLLEAAEQSGASRQDASVARVDLEGLEQAVLSWTTGRPRRVRARFVLDCSGRAGVIARRFRVKDRRLSTVALNGVWQRAGGFRDVAPGHTLVESYRDGWAWSVPLSRERRHVAFMIDPRPGARYADELAKTPQLRRALEDARFVERPWTCDASVYGARVFAGPRFLLVGDASSFLDPMSSFGVKKALASAWLAAVVVNTCLRHPGRCAPALQLYESREREMAATYAHESARHLREAAGRYATPFWKRRAEALPALAAEAAELRGAFEALKASPALSLRWGAGVAFARAPEVRGREVVLQEAVVSPASPTPVRYFRGVLLPRLARIAPSHSDVAGMLDAYNGGGNAGVQLPDLLAALSFSIAKGFLQQSASR